jgi:hypothetical protein
MKTHDEALQQLLRNALAKMDEAAQPSRDLWPQMRALLNQPSAPPWFDWALAGGILVALAFCPSAVPVLLYYL